MQLKQIYDKQSNENYKNLRLFYAFIMAFTKPSIANSSLIGKEPFSTFYSLMPM